MHLYVMRHGPAEERAPSGRDSDRRLTPSGREVVSRVARAFVALRATEASAPRPLQILTSPRLRAHETATILHAWIASTNGALTLRDELGGEAAIPLALIEEVRASGIDTLLVGHQPVVEELVRALVHEPLKLSGFRPGTVVALETTSVDADFQLATLLDPEELPR